MKQSTIQYYWQDVYFKWITCRHFQMQCCKNDFKKALMLYQRKKKKCLMINTNVVISDERNGASAASNTHSESSARLANNAYNSLHGRRHQTWVNIRRWRITAIRQVEVEPIDLINTYILYTLISAILNSIHTTKAFRHNNR